MTEEMYMEAFPQRERVQPRDREQFEDEIADVKHNLAEFAQKREERKKYLWENEICDLFSISKLYGCEKRRKTVA